MTFEDIDGRLDDLQVLFWNSGYGGTSVTSSSIDLQNTKLPQSGAILIATQNGSGGDTVDIDIQHSSDNSTWSDFDASVPTLNDASGEKTHKFDLDDAKRYIRVDLDSGDQTVAASIDVLVAFVAAGSKESQAI